MKKKLVGMIATATLLTMALAGNVQAAEIRSVGPDGEAAVDASTIELTDDQIAQIKEGGYTAAICLALWRKRLVNFSAEGTGRYFWRTWY